MDEIDEYDMVDDCDNGKKISISCCDSGEFTVMNVACDDVMDCCDCVVDCMLCVWMCESGVNSGSDVDFLGLPLYSINFVR